MRRVLIIGNGGAGKSTLGRALAVRTRLPLIHLDKEFWRPGWVQTSKPEWVEKVRSMLAEDAWIMDGNFGGTMEMRMERADTIIFLDLPRWRCFWGILRRRIEFHGRQRPDMPEGVPEQVFWDFVKYLWTYPVFVRPKVLERIDRFKAGRRIEILNDPSAVKKFIENLDREPTPA